MLLQHVRLPPQPRNSISSLDVNCQLPVPNDLAQHHGGWRAFLQAMPAVQWVDCHNIALVPMYHDRLLHAAVESLATKRKRGF